MIASVRENKQETIDDPEEQIKISNRKQQKIK